MSDLTKRLDEAAARAICTGRPGYVDQDDDTDWMDDLHTATAARRAIFAEMESMDELPWEACKAGLDTWHREIGTGMPAHLIMRDTFRAIIAKLED